MGTTQVWPGAAVAGAGHQGPLAAPGSAETRHMRGHPTPGGSPLLRYDSCATPLAAAILCRAGAPTRRRTLG